MSRSFGKNRQNGVVSGETANFVRFEWRKRGIRGKTGQNSLISRIQLITTKITPSSQNINGFQPQNDHLKVRKKECSLDSQNLGKAEKDQKETKSTKIAYGTSLVRPTAHIWGENQRLPQIATIWAKNEKSFQNQSFPWEKE